MIEHQKPSRSKSQLITGLIELTESIRSARLEIEGEIDKLTKEVVDDGPSPTEVLRSAVLGVRHPGRTDMRLSVSGEIDTNPPRTQRDRNYGEIQKVVSAYLMAANLAQQWSTRR